MYDADNTKIDVDIIENINVSPTIVNIEWEYNDLMNLQASASRDSCNLRTCTNGMPLVEGHGSITASFDQSVPASNVKISKLYPLTLSQSIFVRSRLKILGSDKIYLPILSNEVSIAHKLETVGGSGVCIWSSTNEKVVKVDAVGHLTPQELGEARVTCSDKANLRNFATITVQTGYINNIELAEAKTETEVGQNISANVRLADKNYQYFTHCSNIFAQFESIQNYHSVQLRDTSKSSAQSSAFTIVEQPSSPKEGVHDSDVCASGTLTAVREGESKIKCSFEKYEDTATFKAFKPIEILAPAKPQLILSRGSSESLEFKGGPQKRKGGDSIYIENVLVSPNAMESVEIFRIATKRYTVLCLNHTKTVINIEVGNLVNDDREHFLSVISSSEIYFECSPPSLMQIVVSQPATNVILNRRWDTNLSFIIGGPLEDPAMIETWIYSSTWRRFDNASTLDIQWLSSSTAVDVYDCYPTLSESYCMVRALQEDTATVIEAKTVSYVHSYQDGSNFDPISSNRALHFVSNAKIFIADTTITDECSTILVLRSRKSSHKFCAEGGSNLFNTNSFKLDDTDFFHLDMRSENCVIIRHTNLGWENLTKNRLSNQLSVEDHETVGSDTAVCKIESSYVNKLKTSSTNQVENKSIIRINVTALDCQNKKFLETDLEHMNITANYDKALLRLVQSGTGKYSFWFEFEALQIGICNVSISMTNDCPENQLVPIDSCSCKDIVTSTQIPIRIYSALSCSPHTLELVPRASANINCVGGPLLSSGESLHFYSDNMDSVTVETIGMGNFGAVVHAIKSGSSRISVRSVAAGMEATFQVEVVVSDIVGIKINTSVNVAVPGITFATMIYAEVKDMHHYLQPTSLAGVPMHCDWTGNPEVVKLDFPDFQNDLQSEHSSSTEFKYIPSLIVYVTSRAVGHTTLDVKCTIKDTNQEYQDSTELTITEALRVVSPKNLLLPPNGGFKIRTNYDTHKGLRPSFTNLYKSIVDVKQEGLVRVGSNQGFGFVSVTLQSDVGTIGGAESITIEVLPVGSVSLHPSKNSNFVALGSKIKLQVDVGDEHGRIFDSYFGLEISASSSHANVLRVEPESWKSSADFKNTLELELTGLQPGFAVVEVVVSNTDSFLTSFIQLIVGSVITPSIPLHVGADVLFNIRGPPIIGEWNSSDAAVVEIEHNSGQARILKTGNVVISFSNDAWTTSSTLGVSRVAQVETFTENNAISDCHDDHMVALRFVDADNNTFDQGIDTLAQNIFFSCECLETKWAYATEKESACALHFKRPQTTQISEIPKLLTLRITVWDKTSTYKNSTDLEVPFEPCFLLSASTSLLWPKMRNVSLSVLYNTKRVLLSFRVDDNPCFKWQNC